MIHRLESFTSFILETTLSDSFLEAGASSFLCMVTLTMKKSIANRDKEAPKMPPTSTVVYPASSVSCESGVELAIAAGETEAIEIEGAVGSVVCDTDVSVDINAAEDVRSSEIVSVARSRRLGLEVKGSA